MSLTGQPSALKDCSWTLMHQGSRCSSMTHEATQLFGGCTRRQTHAAACWQAVAPPGEAVHGGTRDTAQGAMCMQHFAKKKPPAGQPVLQSRPALSSVRGWHCYQYPLVKHAASCSPDASTRDISIPASARCTAPDAGRRVPVQAAVSGL